MVTLEEIKEHPEKFTYAQRYTYSSHKRKDGTRYRGAKTGPYWYANWMDDGRFRTKYIGKELPSECIPFAPASTYLNHPSPVKGGKLPARLRGASDTILEALDRGDQVVIDLTQIANDCGAHVSRLPHKGNLRFVIYRDPIHG